MKGETVTKITCRNQKTRDAPALSKKNQKGARGKKKKRGRKKKEKENANPMLKSFVFLTKRDVKGVMMDG